MPGVVNPAAPPPKGETDSVRQAREEREELAQRLEAGVKFIKEALDTNRQRIGKGSRLEDPEHAGHPSKCDSEKVSEELQALRAAFETIKKVAGDQCDLDLTVEEIPIRFQEVPGWEAKYHEVKELASQAKAAVSPLLCDFLKYWFARPELDSNTRYYVRQALSEEFSDVVGEEWIAKTEEEVSEAKKQLEELEQKRKEAEFEAFKEARSAQREQLFAALRANVATLKPKYDAWIAEMKAAPLKDLDGGQQAWRDNVGKYFSAPSSCEETFANVPGYSRDKAFTEDFLENSPYFGWWNFVWTPELTAAWKALDEHLTKHSEALFAKMCRDSPYIPSHGMLHRPATNTGKVGEELAERGVSTLVPFSAEETRLRTGCFNSDAERLDYMRRCYDQGLCISGDYYHLKTHWVHMPKLLVDALFLDGGQGEASFLFFPGGNMLEGVDLAALLPLDG